MSILGVSSVIKSGEGLVKAFMGGVDELFTSDEERLSQEQLTKRIQNSPYLAALQIAMVQANSSDRWTSRARPMILYTFCAVFFIDKGLMPPLFWLLQIFHDKEIAPPPSILDGSVIMTVVAGVLGTSWIASRGIEKALDKDK